MGIIIEHMEMPKGCCECRMQTENCCTLSLRPIDDVYDRPEWCLIEEAEPVKHGRWIPCSERLPEYMTTVLVQLTRTADIFVGALVSNVDGKYTMWDLPNFSSFVCMEDVIAWMPLPKPYKMDEVEE